MCALIFYHSKITLVYGNFIAINTVEIGMSVLSTDAIDVAAMMLYVFPNAMQPLNHISKSSFYRNTTCSGSGLKISLGEGRLENDNSYLLGARRSVITYLAALLEQLREIEEGNIAIYSRSDAKGFCATFICDKLVWGFVV